MLKRLALLGFLVTASLLVSGQNRGIPSRTGGNADLTNQADTIRPVREKGRFKKNWNQPYPNPTRAGIYGLIFPGVGQFYNKRYWKVPLVWAGVGGMVYATIFNSNQYNRLNTAYGQRVLAERDPTIEPFDEFVTQLTSAESIKSNRDRYDRTRQTMIFGTIAVYALQALEAYVDAHLKNFDISDDLSFQPILSTNPQHGAQAAVGLIWKL